MDSELYLLKAYWIIIRGESVFDADRETRGLKTTVIG